MQNVYSSKSVVTSVMNDGLVNLYNNGVMSSYLVAMVKIFSLESVTVQDIAKKIENYDENKISFITSYVESIDNEYLVKKINIAKDYNSLLKETKEFNSLSIGDQISQKGTISSALIKFTDSLFRINPSIEEIGEMIESYCDEFIDFMISYSKSHRYEELAIKLIKAREINRLTEFRMAYINGNASEYLSDLSKMDISTLCNDLVATAREEDTEMIDVIYQALNESKDVQSTKPVMLAYA